MDIFITSAHQFSCCPVIETLQYYLLSDSATWHIIKTASSGQAIEINSQICEFGHKRTALYNIIVLVGHIVASKGARVHRPTARRTRQDRGAAIRVEISFWTLQRASASSNKATAGTRRRVDKLLHVGHCACSCRQRDVQS